MIMENTTAVGIVVLVIGIMDVSSLVTELILVDEKEVVYIESCGM